MPLDRSLAFRLIHQTRNIEDKGHGPIAEYGRARESSQTGVQLRELFDDRLVGADDPIHHEADPSSARTHDYDFRELARLARAGEDLAQRHIGNEPASKVEETGRGIPGSVLLRNLHNLFYGGERNGKAFACHFDQKATNDGQGQGKP